ncbi:hypothetical protein M406DRAFT_356893, partial [Cryphonectria parasitica EP155]
MSSALLRRKAWVLADNTQASEGCVGIRPDTVAGDSSAGSWASAFVKGMGTTSAASWSSR